MEESGNVADLLPFTSSRRIPEMGSLWSALIQEAHKKGSATQYFIGGLRMAFSLPMIKLIPLMDYGRIIMPGRKLE